MSVPLDRLYHYIEDLCGQDILIYRFFPHGSKKLEDLAPIKNYPEIHSWHDIVTLPCLICHDQEPLNSDLYSQDYCWQTYNQNNSENQLAKFPWFSDMFGNMLFRSRISHVINVYDKLLLCHSERNSRDLEFYENHGYQGVYWWSHGIIARDWFRYAKYDQKLTVDLNQIKYDFLIYNRAWAGTREYRLKFAELLLDLQLQHQSLTSFSPVEQSCHYLDHEFINKDLSISRRDLEQYFVANTTNPTYSADYNSDDYKQCAIEVVLETVFDDVKQHLTEKILRPIACGRPFILASTPGSLKYLQDYGIQTFDGLIDESYDQIQNPAERLQTIVKEMQRISQLPQQQKYDLWQELYCISRKNQQLFFSDAWNKKITQEFVDNFLQARQLLESTKQASYLKTIVEHCRTDELVKNIVDVDRSQRTAQEFWDLAKKYT